MEREKSGSTGDCGKDFVFLAVAATMERVAEALQRASCTDVRVILYGESGVGKSYAAHYIHQLSSRCSGPLHSLSVREDTAVKVLADNDFLRSLAGGTLILEGVHEASLAVQASLVGALEEWAGQDQDPECPVRVVATSERDLVEGVENGTFRNDLYYLLEVFPVFLPPLRERAEEIPQLVQVFAQRHTPAWQRDVPLSEGFIEAAMGYAWPGNLRELENLVIRAWSGDSREPWRFPSTLNIRGSGAGVLPFQQAKRDFERSYVLRLLLATDGNVTRSAELAGKARKDFYALMARNNIDPAQYRFGGKA